LSREERADIAIQKRAQEIRQQKDKEDQSRSQREQLERQAEEIRTKEREQQSGRYNDKRGSGRRALLLPHALPFSVYMNYPQMMTGIRKVGIEITDDRITGWKIDHLAQPTRTAFLLLPGQIVIVEVPRHPHLPGPHRPYSTPLTETTRLLMSHP